ncbi:cell division protein FtsK [Aggregicoccus sp. 17bor-14]|uniref:MXAN_5187 family protein n=1 Tax=Myxococcaceae TaxID=31 RepID=UPI00129C500A|nr:MULTISPECIES: MXAN_5187 family protein [Myxococcaceae]MBF5042679.1 cell division protein FtsK [Simulacricoccus sp. 17bor-14]MRI88447.1 cell division protein FtsK [Aggregicoccus sp. 17bor-14]
MARLKFLLFALLVLVLGLAHLPLLSGSLGAGAIQEGTAHAAAAAARLSSLADAQRLTVQQLALKLSANPDLSALVRGERGPEAMTALRTDMATGLSPALRETAVLALRAQGQLTLLRGTAPKPSTEAGALNGAALAAIADEGGSLNAFGELHFFVPVPSPDARGAGTLFVGLPLLPAAGLEAAAQGTEAVAFVAGDKMLASAGKKTLAQAGLAALKPGQSGVVSRGAMDHFGPVHLPLGTRGDLLGGAAPLSVGSRQTLSNSALEAVAVVSTAPVMGALAGYQSTALTALLVLLVLSAIWAFLMGERGAREEGATERRSGGSDTLGLSMMPSAPPPAHAGFGGPTPGGPLSTPSALPPLPGEPSAARSGPYPFPRGGDPLPGSGPYPFPRGGDPLPGSGPYPFSAGGGESAAAKSGPYPFPTAKAPEPLPTYNSGAIRFESPPPVPSEHTPAPYPAVPPPPPAGFAPPMGSGHDYEDQPTAVYSLQQAQDPFAAAQPPPPPPPFQGFQDSGEDNPEATRVATIPQELLLAAARQELEAPRASPLPPPPAFAQPPPAPAPAFGGPLTDEQHFEEVFREFIATRERCGEPSDPGLTFDKFVAKLRKNREQLVQKYACRTVRFQVYVKEGKAALKATPVKD